MADTSTYSGRTRVAEADRLPAYFFVAMIAMVVPLNFEVGGLFLTASRLTLLVIAPVLLMRLFLGHYGGLRSTDILFGLFLAWFGLAILVQSPGRFVTFVGSNLVIMVGGYLLGRCCVRGPKSFRQMTIFYGCLVLFSLPFAVYEMRTSIMPIARWLEQIPGITSSQDVDYPSRNDLERVQFVFVHPIHYGLFCAYVFGMIVFGLREHFGVVVRALWGLAIAFCCFSSGSAGPFTGILISCLLAFYGLVSRERWWALIGVSTALYLLVDVLSDRPAYFIVIENLAFNADTAYGRRLILETGVAQVMNTPIFGTPNRLPLPPWMTGSLDNYWLLVAVSYGLPAFIFLMSAYVVTIVKACLPDLSADPGLASLRRGWVIGLIGSMFALATVAVWSELLSLTFLVFGSGVWFASVTPGERRSEAPRIDPRRVRYSRFEPE